MALERVADVLLVPMTIGDGGLVELNKAMVQIAAQYLELLQAPENRTKCFRIILAREGG